MGSALAGMRMARVDQEGVEWVRRCCASAPGGGLSPEAAEELARRLAGRAASSLAECSEAIPIQQFGSIPL